MIVLLGVVQKHVILFLLGRKLALHVDFRLNNVPSSRPICHGLVPQTTIVRLKPAPPNVRPL
eukprot:m.198669 g.198669  ORF g.198669 m.198669 type:complete len:62 (-) comp15299_c0_seq1:6065-6250(-)